MATYPSLANRAVLVTGGGRGIGAALVAAFADQGSVVGFIDRDVESGESLCRAMTAAGNSVRFIACDLADIEASCKVVEQLSKDIGPFRALLNNAGNDAFHDFAVVTYDDFDECIAVNLRHQFFMAQAVAPGMAAAGGGSIINLGSVSWMMGAARVAIYATAKAGVEGLTRSLARELGPSAIRVNSIAPGWVLTERQLAKGAADPAKFTNYLDRQCLKEHLTPNDVAELALWLAADESHLCTGHTWFVDAGVVG